MPRINSLQYYHIPSTDNKTNGLVLEMFCQRISQFYRP